MNLSIVIPISERESRKALDRLDVWLLGLSPCEVIKVKEGTMWEARRKGYEKATQPIIMNLDVDTRVPYAYPSTAVSLIEDNLADAVALDYIYLQGHLAFGTSIWLARILKELYDYSIEKHNGFVKVGSHEYANLINGFCECTYMWRKLITHGGRLETLPYRATHLKG